MSSQEEQFLQTLRATFKVEADEHQHAIAAALLALEKTFQPDEQRPHIELAFRAAHSLKGAARAVNLTEVERICQALEDLFAQWKSGKSQPSPAALDAAHRFLDQVTGALDPTARTASTPPPAILPSVHAALEKPATPDSVRVAVTKLDARLLEAEEMLTAKLAMGQRAAELNVLLSQFEPLRHGWVKAQPQARALRQLREYVGLTEFFEWSHDFLRSLEAKVAAMSRAAQQDQLTVAKLVDDLLADSKKLLMLPLSTLGALLPKIVRDLSRDQGKEAELVVRGEDVQLDKRILEEMKDPLIHLLRNSVDHGIESPAERRGRGKPAKATIALEVSRLNGNHVQIVLTDDGAGVDVERLRKRLVERRLVEPEAAARLSIEEALQFIFEPEVSTSPIITELSGRGLGLAIVREKAERLGGRVTVESRPQVGTTFRIVLPVTMATFRGILVRIADRVLVLPTAEVECVFRFKRAEVRTVESKETLTWQGRAIALVRLAEVLGIEAALALDAAGSASAVILGTGEQRIAFAVDAVLDEQELLNKQLRKPLVRVRHIAGATVLGSGQVAPVLRVSDLLKSAKHAGSVQRSEQEARLEKPRARTVLIAEDSITSRMLLKGILEAAGYRVKTAVDGIEAYTMLRSEQFDLLVSDVEMPRLNGFDLTTRVRADRKLAELPVVLVTALQTREDRERGIDAGANAYLVKSNLDQSNLLEAVRRLI